MDEQTLGPALRNETYEFVGRRYKELLDRARREGSHAHGAILANLVLGYLLPEGERSAPNKEEEFFRDWVDRHGGKHPGLSPYERVRSGEDAKMETKDFRWVGLAVFVALAGGAFVWLLGQRRGDAAVPPRPPPTPPPKQKPVRFAVAAFSGKVRDTGLSATSAGDLLTQATFWWAGGRENWDALMKSAGLMQIDELPSTDDALLVIVYEALPTFTATPSSRPEGATRLRDAAAAGELAVVGSFSVGDPSRLSAVGFRR